MQASNWRLAFYSNTKWKPIKLLTTYYFKNMIMSFLFFITVYFSPANYLEKLIISIFTMKAGTWEKWEISMEDYFKVYQVKTVKFIKKFLKIKVINMYYIQFTIFKYLSSIFVFVFNFNYIYIYNIYIYIKLYFLKFTSRQKVKVIHTKSSIYIPCIRLFMI